MTEETLTPERSFGLNDEETKNGSPWKKRWIFVKESFGFNQEPILDLPFCHDDIERYYTLTSQNDEAAIDEQTVKDLDIHRYCEVFFSHTSIFGQQLLHQQLRCGAHADDAAMAMHRYQALADNPHRLARYAAICLPLREAGTEVAAFLFEREATTVPAWTRHLWLLPCIFVASFLATAFSWYAMAGLMLAFACIVSLQIKHYNAINAWDPLRKSLFLLVGVGLALKKESQRDTALEQFRDHAELCKKLVRTLRPSRLVNFMAWAGAYADWFLLKNILNYYRSKTKLERYREDVQHLFEHIARFELDIAVARHLRACGTFCWVTRTDASKKITLQGVRNPFLKRNFPLDLDFKDRGIFLSGKNGIGKSTLLRTVGLNLVVGRAFDFCYAAAAAIPSCPIYTSINIEDSLSRGESLYMAELRRASELILYAKHSAGAIFIIDEIFRGTNHLESVSAAAAVLRALSAHCPVLVSSHNLVLAPLLANNLEPRYVSMTDAGALAVLPGILEETNGIALMQRYEFGALVQKDAEKICEWLSGYLAHPAEVPDLFTDSHVPLAEASCQQSETQPRR